MFIIKDFEYTFSQLFCQSFGLNYPQCLNKFALCVLKPECLVLNRVHQALSEFKKLGYVPIFIRIKKLTQNQVFSLWKYGWEKADLTRIILNCVTMEWNNSAVLILQNDAPHCSDSCRKLNTQKDRDLNSEGYSIRERLGAINKYINFIHISDNTEEMIRELPILLELDEIICLMHTIKSNKTLSVVELSDIFNPFIGNCRIESTEKCVNSFLRSIENQTSTKTFALLKESCVLKRIPSNLFLKLYREGMIEWNWNNILLFTEYTTFKE